MSMSAVESPPQTVKFTASTKDLGSALLAASKIVNTHTTVAILQNLLVIAEDGGVTVRSTDLEMTLDLTISADVLEPGSFTVPAKTFADYVGNLPKDTITIAGSATLVQATCGRSKYDFLALPAREYPPTPPVKAASGFTLATKAFVEGVNAISYAASLEEARGAVLMGVYFRPAGQRLTMVATDSYKLAQWVGPLDDTPEEGELKDYIVPRRALEEVARNVGDAEFISVHTCGPVGNQMVFVAGATRMIVRLVDGSYPNYTQVIPAKFDRKIVVNAEAFAQALRRARVCATDGASLVTLTIADHRMVITSHNGKVGTAFEELEVEQECEGLTIRFNEKYLTMILDHTAGAQVQIDLLGEFQPARFQGVEAGTIGESFAILMPLRK